jgi:hypothetical protein
MIKSSKEMIFACETHRNCYETLLEIIQEGTKPNLGKIERLTVGVSVGLFDKYWRTAPWKIEFVSLVEKEQLKWEKEGGSVGKKLKLTLQTMIESGKQITPKDICTKTGVHTWYLSSTTLKNHWQRELYLQVKKEQLKWERNGGQDFKVGIEVLKNIIKSGERPNIKAVALKMGKRASYFNRKTYNWQKKLVKIIQKAEDKWKKNGGKWRKLFNETIDKYAKEGLRPQISVICDEIGYTTSNISNGTFLWQLIVQNKIINAEKNWIKHGGSDAIKCKKALITIVKEGKNPTPSLVAQKAGFGHAFLEKDLFLWKIRILKEIEKKVRKGLKRNHVIYIDVKSLINKQQIINDYYKLGISIKNPKSELSTYFILSQIMYETYHIIKKNKTKNQFFVDYTSFKKERKVYIDGIINSCEGKKYSILVTSIPRMINAALWLGDNIPLTLNEAKNSFFEYSILLHKKIKANELSYSVANKDQLAMIQLLAGMFTLDNDEITKDYRPLLISQKSPRSNAFTNNAKFTQEEFSYTFNFYFHLFNQLADFVLKNKEFPQIIKLPRGSATILGVGQNLISPSYKLPKQQCIGIDYLDGHILNDIELQELAKKNEIKRISFYYQSRNEVLKNISLLNSNKNHPKRLSLGKKALDAWFICMLYLTSTNDSILGLYEWSENDEYEMEQDERKEFITIKPRANNKTIRFTIPKAFIPSFKKAIKLRKFVLNGYTFPYLFFQAGIGKEAKTTGVQFKGGMSSVIVKSMIKSIDDKLPKITSRSIRKDSSRDAIISHGVKTALSVLQNQENTLINNYNGFTVEELSSQVINLLETIHETVISDNPIDSKKQSTMGGCNNEEQLIPETFNDENIIKANCDDPKSCIFCTHFITFPSDNEIRKLLSLKYLIENVAYDRAENDISYENKMRPWIERIETIFNLMKKKYPESIEIINHISIEVYQEGLLSPYWLDWLIDLDELGRFS